MDSNNLRESSRRALDRSKKRDRRIGKANLGWRSSYSCQMISRGRSAIEQRLRSRPRGGGRCLSVVNLMNITRLDSRSSPNTEGGGCPPVLSGSSLP